MADQNTASRASRLSPGTGTVGKGPVTGRRRGTLLGRLWPGVLAAILPLAACGPQAPEPESEEPLSITGPLAGEAEAEGYDRVTGPRPFSFPADHGPHPGYRHEWWYITGNLDTGSGRRFGYQITFFRFNVAPGMGERRSALASNQVWMAHFGITDPEGGNGGGGRFLHSERFARGGNPARGGGPDASLAGARAVPFRVWLEDWKLVSLNDGSGNRDQAAINDPIMPLRLTVKDPDMAVDLTLNARKPLVLQGDAGYSRKGQDPGNASHYYSYTRLITGGEITVDGERFPVTGESWMDREWGTSALSEDQQGWDWFSLQLSDDRDIMFYQLRHTPDGDDNRAGIPDPRSKGLMVQPDGAHRVLTVDEVELVATRHWSSPGTDTAYPVAWRMRIPGEELELRIEAVQDDQELRSGFRYWEGAVDVTGTAGGEAIGGRGYLEMTGYAQ